MTAKRIVRTPDVLHGAPRFDGTRIFAEMVCRSPATPTAWWIDAYPALTEEDIDAALAWCARPDRRLGRWLRGKRAGLIGRFCERWGYE